MELKEPVSGDNASVTVNTTSGLVSSVVGSEAGTTLYSYESGKLTAKQNAEGQTKYTKDSSGRLKRIDLPNGTWAEITYDALSRATAVTVDPAGPEGAKTTHFFYGEEPRETRVWGGGEPEIIYSIGEDGSVFKWWYAEVPPAIDSISGSLWGNRNSTTPIENKDHTLFITGSSPHEIASVRILVNGNAVVAEKTCEDTSVPPDHHCEHVTLPWVTNAAEHAPGQLNLEVVVTDFLGHSTGERFFVTIPQQPPPGPDTVEPPSFASTKLFREEYGLDRGKNLTEEQQIYLILELLFEWELQQATQVKAVEEWGVPMRQPELEEMEYRRRYTNQAAEVIPQWSEEHASSTYGGFYVDDRAGGHIYVGFTENQHSLVESLKQTAGLINPGAIYEYPTPPTKSVSSLNAATLPAVSAAIEGSPSIDAVTSFIYVAPEGNVVQVGATDPEAVRSFLVTQFGQNAPIRVIYEARPVSSASRYASGDALAAGSGLIGATGTICTSGFGARAAAGEQRGRIQYKYYALTAGHCFGTEEAVGWEIAREGNGLPIGSVRRRQYGAGGVEVDGEGVWLQDESLRSHSVLNGDPLAAQPIQGAQAARLHRTVCWSGINGKDCGSVVLHGKGPAEDGHGGHKWMFLALGVVGEGDSGGPVWDPETHKAVGLITSETPGYGGKCWSRPARFRSIKTCNRMLFTPLLPSGGSAGVDPTLGVEVLQQE